MNANLEEITETALALISHLSEKDREIKTSVIEQILLDYDFFGDPEENRNITPVEILDDYLNTFFELDKGYSAYSEWVSLLLLYLIPKIEKSGDERHVEIASYLRDLSLRDNERAATIEHRKKAKNKKISRRLSKIKYAPNKRLRKLAFKEYEKARQKLNVEEKAITYDSIARLVLPEIEKYNISPKTGERIIGRDDQGDADGVAHNMLVKWFGQGVRKKKLKSTRAK